MQFIKFFGIKRRFPGNFYSSIGFPMDGFWGVGVNEPLVYWVGFFGDILEICEGNKGNKV
jgi:hypothetical protein